MKAMEAQEYLNKMLQNCKNRKLENKNFKERFFLKQSIGPIIAIMVLIGAKFFFNMTDMVGIFSILIIYSMFAGGAKIGFISGAISIVYILNRTFFMASIPAHTKFHIIFRLANSLLLIGAAFLIGNMMNRLKASNEKLQKKQMQLERAEALSSVMVVHGGLDGKILKVTSQFCDFIGYSQEELLSMKFDHITHPDDLDMVCNKENFKSIYEGKKHTFDMEKRYIRKDGQIVWAYVNVSMVSEEDGTPLYLLAYIKDITKRKYMEQAVAESEKRLRQITDNMLDLIHQLNNEGMITYISPSCRNILGYDPNDLIGKNIFDFIHPDDLNRVMNACSYAIETGMEDKVEYRYRHVDGHYIWIESVGNPMFNKEGEFIGAMVAGRDIMDRKRAEKNERLLREAHEYDELRSEFFANISHELRTPLNVILGTLQLLDVHLKEPYHHNLKKYKDIMKQNCNRLLRLVNNLIDITKIDTDFFEIKLKNINIVSLIEEITLSVADYIENKGITLQFDTDIEEKMMACDPDKIERIILNLLSNAVKFTDVGGNIQVSIYNGETTIRISVKDTGIGIPKEQISTIFERFRQVDKSLSRNHEGSGIGLSLVKSFVEMHNGEIYLESEYGLGTEFIITLPIQILPQEDNEFERIDPIQWGCIERIQVEFSDIYS